MKTLALLVLLLGLPVVAANAQESDAPEGAIVDSVEMSGFSPYSLSPGLQKDLNSLVGAPLSRERLNVLVSRIEGEQPENHFHGPASVHGKARGPGFAPFHATQAGSKAAPQDLSREGNGQDKERQTDIQMGDEVDPQSHAGKKNGSKEKAHELDQDVAGLFPKVG